MFRFTLGIYVNAERGKEGGTWIKDGEREKARGREKMKEMERERGKTEREGRDG